MGSIGMNFSFWPFIIFLPIFYQTALHYDIVTAGCSLLAYTLPTLVVPPMAERLSHRYQPGIVIPLGMFTIGLGFILMRFGAVSAVASGLTMLPGSLVAGVGLGLTNTPTTNTTTGSVPSNRAGMASGMDISARLISLAINIAVMKSMFKFRAAGLSFTGEMAKCCASDKIRIAASLSKELVRYTVSASTAPTQASSTMQALQTLGVVINKGSPKLPVYELTDTPATTRLQSLLAA